MIRDEFFPVRSTDGTTGAGRFCRGEVDCQVTARSQEALVSHAS